MDKDLCKAFLYEYLSVGFSYPTSESISLMKSNLENLREAINCLKINFDIEEFKKVLEVLDLFDIQGEYNNLFLIGLKAPNFETAYEIDKNSKGAEISDIDGFYNAFGLKISKPIEPDNIQVELEFLSLLLQKKIFLEEKNDEEGVQICNDGYKKFLQDHIGRWYDIFINLIKLSTDQKYYLSLSDLLRKFLDIETEGLKINKIIEYKEEIFRESTWECGIDLSKNIN
ncbi:MAG: molecular chaperone TorD family protein [Hydrogenothermaceae bacterium]